jgi:hypothetical protein
MNDSDTTEGKTPPAASAAAGQTTARSRQTMRKKVASKPDLSRRVGSAPAAARSGRAAPPPGDAYQSPGRVWPD